MSGEQIEKQRPIFMQVLGFIALVGLIVLDLMWADREIVWWLYVFVAGFAYGARPETFEVIVKGMLSFFMHGASGAKDDEK